jgi:hypothetical protein
MAVDIFNQGRKTSLVDPAMRYRVSVTGRF